MDTSTRDIDTFPDNASKVSMSPGPSIANLRSLLTLILLCSAQFMMVLDFSIVNVALPALQKDLAFSTANLQWIVTAYSLTFGGFLLLGGRLGDLFGRRRLFIIGLALFALASLLGGIAQSALWLISARAVQGLGAAIILPTSFTLITTTFQEGPERNKALGVISAVASTGFAAGAILGGLLTAGPGWRWVFFVNVPVAIAAMLLAPFLVRETAKEQGPRQLDVFGAISITLALVALVYALAQGNTIGWGSLQTLGLLVLACILFVIFIWIEKRVKTPLIRLSLFSSWTFTGANLIGLLAPGTLGAMVFIVTLYLQKVLGYSPTATGSSFLPLSLLILIDSNVAAHYIPRLGVRRILIVGMLIMAVGLLWLAQIGIDNNYLGVLLPGSLIVGLGIGPAFTAIAVGATSGISDSEQGQASGVLNTVQQVGSGLVLAIVSIVAAARTVTLQQQHVIDKIALVEGFRSALLTCAFVAILAALAALFILRSPQKPHR